MRDSYIQVTKTVSHMPRRKDKNVISTGRSIKKTSTDSATVLH